MDWPEILNDINEDFFSEINLRKQRRIESGKIDQKALTNFWLGFPPTTEKALQQKEEVLKTQLPLSYRQFLLTSNGFREISPFIYNLYPLEKIDWASNIEDPSFLDGVESADEPITDEIYLYYEKDQPTPWFRGEYLRHSLKISDWGDASCIFLNPIIQHSGEWEVIEYANWLQVPGDTNRSASL